MADLLPFSLAYCPKCKGTDVRPVYKVACPDNAVCEGTADPHLHIECMTCRFLGAMQTADTGTITTPTGQTTTTVVASAKKKRT